MEIVNYLIYVVGFVVCGAGGIFIASVLLLLAINKLLELTGTMNIVVQWWLAKKNPKRFHG